MSKSNSIIALNKFEVTGMCFIGGKLFTGYTTWTNWTPTAPSNLALSAVGKYTQIGYQVFLNCCLSISKVGDSNTVTIGGIPLIPNSNININTVAIRNNTDGLILYSFINYSNDVFNLTPTLDNSYIFESGKTYIINFQVSYNSSPNLVITDELPKTPFNFNTVRVSKYLSVRGTDRIYRYINPTQWLPEIAGSAINPTNFTCFYTGFNDVIFVSVYFECDIADLVDGQIDITLPINADISGTITWSGTAYVLNEGVGLDTYGITGQTTSTNTYNIRWSLLANANPRIVTATLIYKGIFT